VVYSPGARSILLLKGGSISKTGQSKLPLLAQLSGSVADPKPGLTDSTFSPGRLKGVTWLQVVSHIRTPFGMAMFIPLPGDVGRGEGEKRKPGTESLREEKSEPTRR
jgi:hypothetical protein